MTESLILIVEDDQTLREVLQYNLDKEGYHVITASDGAEGLEVARSRKPQLVILDLMLPVMNGLEVCRIIHSEMQLPIIILTAKAEEVDRVVGLELGADDYLTKPFSMRELLARIKAVLRRTGQEKRPGGSVEEANIKYLEAGNLKVDLAKHKVYKGGKLIDLNPKEFELLAMLISNKGQVISREQILRKIWGYEYFGNARTVDVHIRWLRQKLEDDSDHPRYLLTVRGYGYRMDA